MLTGEIRSQIDQIWNAFANGGISNPLEVIEQVTYLLFTRRLDDLHTLEENKANRTKKQMARRVFPEGGDAKGRPYEDFRWSRFKHFEAKEMFTVVSEHVFPFLRSLGGGDSTYSQHMEGARFTIPTPSLLARVVDMIDRVPMEDRDTKGDLYEYMLGKIATAGRNGQFRTPRHIIQLMVEMVAPQPKDIVCDPACGTAGFLVATGENLRDHHPEIFRDDQLREHFHHHLFHGFDFDNTMLRIGSMNMLLHGVENPDIRYRDSLAQDHAGEEEKYTLVLANPPFAGSLDYENCAKDLQQIVKTKKTELLFLALFLRLLKPGGRAAVIVPDGVLFGSSNAHKTLRRILVEEQKLDAVISLPGGVFKPYAGVSTAILLFTKTNSGGTDHVWFYDVDADGMSLDDKRTELLPPEKLGPVPSVNLTSAEHAKNNLPDILARWTQRDRAERQNPRTAQSFCVPKADLAAQGYDLSLNRYKGSRPRRNRAPPAGRNPAKPRQAGDRDSAGHEGNGGDAAVSLPRKPFGSVCHLVNGKAFKPTDWSPAGAPIIRIQNLNGSDKPFNYWAGTLDKQVLVKTGDLLLAWSGTPGTSFGAHIWSGSNGILNQHIFRCDLNEKAITKEWAKIAVNHRLHRLIEQAHGGVGLQHVTRGMVEDLEISLPPLAEQRRIAEVLDRAEALRAQRRAALAQLDTLTQSLFLDLFGDPATNPKGWPKTTLGEIIEFVGGSQPPRETFTYEPSADTIRLVQIRDFRTDAFKTYIPKKLARRFFETDDVMIGRYGPPVFQILRGLAGSYNVALMKALPRGEILKDFIFHLLQEQRLHSFVVGRSERTAGQSGVNLELLEKYPAYLPPIAKQREFARRVTAVERLKTAHRASLAELDALFATLQHRAFRGEL